MFSIKRALLKSRKNAEESIKYAEKLLNQKNFGFAEIIIRDILSFNHRCSLAYLGLAKISWIKANEVIGLGMLDIDEEIENYLNDALHYLDPDNSRLHLKVLFFYYHLYSKQENFSKAIDICIKMLKIDPDLLDIRKYLVGFYCNIGDNKNAIKEYLIIKSKNKKIAEKAKDIIETYAQLWDESTKSYKSSDIEELIEKYNPNE